MPQFAPGVAKIAVAPIVAKPSGMNCEAELFLGPDDATKVVTSGRVPFVSTGVAKNVNLPITMPGSPGSYHGYIDVFAGGLRFLAYRLTEDVVIAAVEQVNLLAQGPTNLKTFWGLDVYDPVQRTKTSRMGATQDMPSLNFIIKSKEFLLVPDYLPSWPVGYPWQYGPYKVVVPDWGNYTLDIIARTIPGAVLTDIGVSGVSRSRVVCVGRATGGYTDPTIGYPAQFMGQATVISSTPLSGKIDIGAFLVEISETFWFNISLEQAQQFFSSGANVTFSADLYVGFWAFGYPGAARALYFGLSSLTAVPAKLSALVISPQEVAPGQTVTIACLATNPYTCPISAKVKLTGDFQAEQVVGLQPGGSKAVSFKVTPTVGKTYSVSVDGLTGNFRMVAPINYGPLSVERGAGVFVARCRLTNTTGSKLSVAIKLNLYEVYANPWYPESGTPYEAFFAFSPEQVVEIPAGGSTNYVYQFNSLLCTFGGNIPYGGYIPGGMLQTLGSQEWRLSDNLGTTSEVLTGPI